MASDLRADSFTCTELCRKAVVPSLILGEVAVLTSLSVQCYNLEFLLALVKFYSLLAHERVNLQWPFDGWVMMPSQGQASRYVFSLVSVKIFRRGLEFFSTASESCTSLR